MAFSLHVIVLFASCSFATIILFEIFPPRGVEQINVIELSEMLAEHKEDYQYIDVRPVDEFNELHVFGFQNIPFKQLKKELHTLSKEKKVVVICQRGTIGNEACRLLKRNGFTDLANVRGGVITWEPHV